MTNKLLAVLAMVPLPLLVILILFYDKSVRESLVVVMVYILSTIFVACVVGLFLWGISELFK